MIAKALYALIPAYEPTEMLPHLVRRLAAEGLKVVVVDDGSGEGFDEIFNGLEDTATVLRHKANMGKGQALKTGLLFISRSETRPTSVVTVDADGQHRPEDAMRCLSAVTPGVLVLGCRGFERDVPLRSRMGNSITRLVFRLSSGVAVSDTQTGLRAFDGEMIPTLLAISGDRYEYEMNMLLELAKKKVPFREVPIETVYFANNSGSHFSTVRDSYRIYKEILKFAASSFLGFVTDYSAFTLLSLLTAALDPTIAVPVCNVAARLISASVNFTVNKKFVFHDDGSYLKSGLQYAALAGCILLFNTLLISFLTGFLGVNRYIAKLVTEVTFFTLSWLVQKLVIFRKPHRKGAIL